MKKKKKTVYIGGTKYFVREVGSIKKPKGVYGRGIRIFGQFRPRTNEIVHIKGLGFQKNITLIHEIIHAIDREFGGNLNEHSVDVLSRELSGVLSQLGLLK